MAVAQHETGSAGSGRFHLDKLAFRFRQRISARQDVANDGLQMTAAHYIFRLTALMGYKPVSTSSGRSGPSWNSRPRVATSNQPGSDQDSS